MNNNHSRMRIGEERHDTGYVDQTSVTQKDGMGNVLITAFGGWHKIERAAIEIAAANPDMEPNDCVNRANDVLRYAAELIKIKQSMRT